MHIPMRWKEKLVDVYLTVPKSWREGAWRIGIGLTAISSLLFGYTLLHRPELLTGLPIDRRSPIERMAEDKKIKDAVFELMEEFFFSNRPFGLMFVSWEELDSMVGMWVVPADKFPGKSGAHGLTADIRSLGGPFLFGECAHTESLAMPGKTMVACPIVNSYDVWGYVAAVIETDPDEIEAMERLLHFLAHRIAGLIY